MSLQDKLTYQISFNMETEIKYAFRLGLLWNRLPEWIREDLEKVGTWYDYHFSIQIVADTKTSWHEGYRSLRDYGWERVEAKREGGLITYMMEYKFETEDGFTPINHGFPEEFLTTRLQYQVTLPTCRQVKTGTKEVDVFETVCDDIEEPTEETDPIADSIAHAAEDVLNDDYANYTGAPYVDRDSA